MVGVDDSSSLPADSAVQVSWLGLSVDSHFVSLEHNGDMSSFGSVTSVTVQRQRVTEISFTLAAVSLFSD